MSTPSASIKTEIDVYEDGALPAKPRIAAALVSLPSDKSFTSFQEARAMCWGQGR